ncbi:hypothetical protein PDJAM_G00040970 [Pangasius djambal]|uniref:Uncharacterized protein n=1 Tax=Pangasius djambal TaxID=1691987 RepID=A0ACC5YSV4_9TELE|nr:hypothetical protein [Pangasius djambal]
MGTTASAAPPPASEGFHSNTMMDSRQPLSPAPFIHTNRAKSIITNKVAPVVITLNCKQEFQIHDDVIKTNYTVGRISDNMPEHFLVQEVIVFCVREEPVVFLRVEDDFVPYTPRKKENLHENLQGLSKNMHVENLELNIRKELHDFARLNENAFYIYNDIEHFKDEPQRIIISCEEDIHVTEEVYRRPVFTMPSYRYHRLPLPVEGAPLEEHFDAFVKVLRETPSLCVKGGGACPPPALLFSCQAVGVVLSYLADERRRYSAVLWVCVQDELVLECNGQMFCPREPTCPEQQISLYGASAQEIEELECSLKEEVLGSQKWLEVTLEQEKQMKMFKSCRTLQEIFNTHKQTHQGLQYTRIPLPECAAPREEDFDRLLEAMKSVLADDSRAAFVFNCSNGGSRSTTAMTIATLTLWHFNGFPEFGEEEIVSVPDAKYTKGEFEVVMRLIRLLPDGHRMKREVDIALDSVSETMTPMHHHLREIIICTYRQMKSCKNEQECGSLMLKSVQYLERYIYLILFNTYLHLEKKNSLQRSFSTWMHQVAAQAGVYDLLNQLTFSEFENLKDSTFSHLRFRWREQTNRNLPYRGEII